MWPELVVIFLVLGKYTMDWAKFTELKWYIGPTTEEVSRANVVRCMRPIALLRAQLTQ